VGTRAIAVALAAVCLIVMSLVEPQMLAESTISCPAGQYDMLDWMTLDSDQRGSHFLQGNANPLYTTMWSTKFYWTKGASGYPWDIQLYDNNYIYLWITEWTWTNPYTFKKFAHAPGTTLCQGRLSGIDHYGAKHLLPDPHQLQQLHAG
jgi:hypothetical protein